MSPWRYETAYLARQINDIRDPSRNHSIDDVATCFTYDRGRYVVVAVFDGVSEAFMDKKIDLADKVSSMLAWQLERFCNTEKPNNIHKIARWVIDKTNDDDFMNKGATTIAMVRFDSQTGAVDGMTVGDSPALMARWRNSRGEWEVQTLTGLHMVANNPGIITRRWEYGVELKLSMFQTSIPDEFDIASLVVMTDGYGKMTDEDTMKYMDDDAQDRLVAEYFSHFARVYLPEEAIRRFPDIPVAGDGSSPYEAVSSNTLLQRFLAEFYSLADDETRAQMAVVDLDYEALGEFYDDPEGYVQQLGLSMDEFLDAHHPALGWMLAAPIDRSKDSSGFDDYLREYMKAELFTASMLDEMLDMEGTLQKRLNTFFSQLGPIGDDFSVAMIEITED